jgi:hypothetical protein
VTLERAAEVSAYASAVSALIALFAAIFIVKSARQATSSLVAQRISSDVETVLSLWERLDHHWCRFRISDGDNKPFEFGQLIGYYELACSLFRTGTLSTDASRTLYEHLRDILPSMKANEDFSKLFDELRSNSDTYDNIRWFEQRGHSLLDNTALREEISRKLRCYPLNKPAPSV